MEEDKKEAQVEQNKVTRHAFFFELPLYESIELSKLEDDFWDFMKGDVDAYNPVGLDTTYQIELRNLSNDYHSSYEGYYAAQLICRRKHTSLEFFLYKSKEVVIKVGQLPSLATLQYAEIGKKYDKILSKKDLHDLKKAIGLSAHGAGAGSLVYLRRIFENIIWETYKKHKSTLGIFDEDFLRKKMDEKVDFLKKYLPSQLVEMKAVYGVLSKGVHELSEKECLAYFPALKLSIELILDQKIEDLEKREKDKSIKEGLANIVKNLKYGK